MGYRTYFNLFIHINGQPDTAFNGPESQQHAIVQELRETYTDAFHALDEDGSCKVETSWNDDDKQMAEFSQRYPTMLFELCGQGDDEDDRWIKYFKNGKMQVCMARIKFPPYCEDQLKEPAHE